MRKLLAWLTMKRLLLRTLLLTAALVYTNAAHAQTRVQSTAHDCGSTNSCSAIFPSALTLGNSVALAVRAGEIVPVNASDSLGNILAIVASQNQDADPHRLVIFCAPITKAGIDTITATKTSGSTLRIVAVEFSGSCTVDAQSSSEGSDNAPATPAVPTPAGDFLFAAASSGNPENFSANNGFILDLATSKVAVAEAPGGSSIGAVFGMSGSDLWAAVMVAFRTAPPPPPASVTLAVNPGSSALFDDGKPIMPSSTASVTELENGTWTSVGTVTSDALGLLTGSLKVDPSFVSNGNVWLSLNLKGIPAPGSQGIDPRMLQQGSTGVTLKLVIFKAALLPKSVSLALTP